METDWTARLTGPEWSALSVSVEGKEVCTWKIRVLANNNLLKDETGHTLLNLKEKPSVGTVMPLYWYTSHVRVILVTSTEHTPPFEGMSSKQLWYTSHLCTSAQGF